MNAENWCRERERGFPFARDDSFVRLAMNLVSNNESKLWWGVGQPNEKSSKPRATSCCQFLHRHLGFFFWLCVILSLHEPRISSERAVNIYLGRNRI